MRRISEEDLTMDLDKAKRNIEGHKRVIESCKASHHYNRVAINYEHIAKIYKHCDHIEYAKAAFMDAAIYYIKAEMFDDAVRILTTHLNYWFEEE